MKETGYLGGAGLKPERVDAVQRSRALVDLALGYGLILATIWTPSPWRYVLCFVTVGWVVLSTWNSFAGWRAAGISRSGFLRSVWVVGVALVLVAAAVLLASKVHTLHAPHGA